jgi:hypothetical protein
MNPARGILNYAQNEEIQAVVFGKNGDSFIENNTLKRGHIYSWKEVEGILDHDYYCDYGEHTLPSMNVWTKSFIIFTTEYDGANSIGWIYRNPTSYEPEMF